MTTSPETPLDRAMREQRMALAAVRGTGAIPTALAAEPALASAPPAPAVGEGDAVTLDDLRRAVQVWNGWPSALDPGEQWLTSDSSALAMRRVLAADLAACRAGAA